MSFPPQGPGPLPELTLWERRATVLGALTEQLKQPAVEKILKVLGVANAGIAQTFEGTIIELTNYHLESNSNSRYLKTMERHFLVNSFYHLQKLHTFCFWFLQYK